MSRSGYTDDIYCNWLLICWRGAVASAIRGKRGQQFLKELLSSLDAMPEKKLIRDELVAEGQFCTLGVIGHQRSIDMTGIDPDNRDQVAAVFGIAPAMAAEIVYMNDEYYGRATPEERWQKMRDWVSEQIKSE
ncbi:hypothetical protein [Methylophaga lonarensis]|uniref:hypothetical protein n=1 Tax=Methylophaga lonarensis TaxID=999151 RepID=UPI003D2B5C1E